MPSSQSVNHIEGGVGGLTAVVLASRTLSFERYVEKPAVSRPRVRHMEKRDAHRKEREEAGFRTEIREGSVGSAQRRPRCCAGEKLRGLAVRIQGTTLPRSISEMRLWSPGSRELVTQASDVTDVSVTRVHVQTKCAVRVHIRETSMRVYL